MSVPAPDLLDVDFSTGAATDASASARPAVTTGAPAFSTDPVLGRTVASFNALQGGGANSEVLMPSSYTADAFSYNIQNVWNTATPVPLVSGAITLECQFRVNETLPTAREMDVCGDKNGGGIGLMIPANSTNLTVQAADSTGAYKGPNAAIQGGKWYDAVVTFDGAAVTLFVNGAAGSPVALTTMKAPSAANQFLAVGGSPSGSGLNYRGDVSFAAARAWSSALPADQVAQLFADSGIDADAAAVTPATLVLPADSGPVLPGGVSWPATLPTPDLLDVSFANGTTTDTVTGGAPKLANETPKSGDTANSTTPPLPATPVTAPILATDTTLSPSRQVLSLEGSYALGYPSTTAWQSDSPVSANQAISYECQFMMTSLSNHEQDFCGSKYSGGAGFYVSANSTTLNAIINNGAYVGPTAPIALNTWYDAVLTYGNGKVSLYLNGEPVAMVAVATGIKPPTYRFFGVGGTISNAAGTAVNNNPYTAGVGYLAASRAWASTLTDAQVAALASISGIPTTGDGGDTGEVTVPDANILDVDFAHGSAMDHATGQAPVTVGAPVTGFDDTLNRSVASFNGTVNGTNSDGYAYDFADAWNAGHSPNITEQVTIECYFKFNGTLPTAQENKVCSGTQTGGYGTEVTGGNILTMFYIGGGYRSVSAPLPGGAGAWVHVVSTYDGKRIKLFVNGELQAFAPVSGHTGPPGGTAFVLGGDTASTLGSFESGAPTTIAAARVWSTALTGAQVAKLYEQDTTVVAPPVADVLDVDFSAESFADHAANRIGTVFDDPAIHADPTLGRPVASYDGLKDAVIYPITDAWSAANTPNIVDGVTIQCDFRFDGEFPTTSEKDVCSGKETGGYATYVTGNQVGTMLYIAGSYRNVRATIQPGVWYSAITTFDKTTGLITLYLNGKLAAISAVTAGTGGTPPQSNPTAWALGSDINGTAKPQTPATVTIAEARLWGHALTATEAQALYADAFGSGHTNITLSSSVPGAGDSLTAPVELSADIVNEVQATGWSYTIDGTTVQPGAMVGAGLAAGNHVLRITATDVFGVPVAFTVPFTSVAIPGGSTGSGDTTDTDQGGGKVTLSAVATSSNGGDVTTTFRRATASVAEGGTQGTVAMVPSTLDFAPDSIETVAGVQLAGDGATSASPSVHDQLPFQRFDVTVPEGAGRRVQWVGSVDPERSVSLRVWDLAKSQWVEVAGGRGSSTGDTTLLGTVPTGADDNGVVHVLVIADDPFADDLATRDGAEATADASHFDDPADYDFSFVHWTDPQHIAVGAAAASGETGSGYNTAWPNNPSQSVLGSGKSSYAESVEEGAIWKAAYESVATWVTANAQEKKIAYLAATGDMIDNNRGVLCETRAGLCDEVDREFQVTKDTVHDLDESGVPFQMIAGNHDNQDGAQPGPSSIFSQTFTQDLIDQARNWDGAEYHTMGEQVDELGDPIAGTGDDAQNSYVLFSAGGLDFVAVGLSYGVTQAEADWASGVFQKYHDRNGILITHGYLGASGNKDGRVAGLTDDGSLLYSAVVSANPNVFLVLAGHIHGVGTNIETITGPQINHKVVELLADYQEYQMKASQIFTADTCATCLIDAGGNIDVDGNGTIDHTPNDILKFGASFARMLQFNAAKGTMSVDSYSPFFDEFGTHTYDSTSPIRYNGAEDNFTIPVDLTSRKTSFTTDGLVVVTPNEGDDAVIGTATAKSGWPASVTWTGLVEGQTYAWTATSKDASGDALGSSEQFGGIFVATAAGTDATAPVLTVPASTEIQVGDDFDPMAGVTASDNADGDLTGDVTVTGSVDTSTPGSYPLLYSVADTNGNVAQGTRTVKVNAVPVAPKTTTSVAAGNVTVEAGQLGTVTLKATVSPASATGQVHFLSGEELLCQATVTNGVAQCTVAPNLVLPTGANPVVAYYFGDDTHASAFTAITVTLTEPKSAQPQPLPLLGSSVSVKVKAGKVRAHRGKATVSVVVSAQGATPTGTITVKVGKLSRTVTLVNGTATVKVGKFPKAGKKKVVVTYGGDTAVAASTTTTSFTVKKAAH